MFVVTELFLYIFKAFNSEKWRVMLRRDRVAVADATERVPPVRKF
jgi:hypothetical protein